MGSNSTIDIVDILFEQCRDFMIFRMSDGIRNFGLFMFILSNTILACSLVWWWIHRRNPRLLVRSKTAVIFTALYSFGDSIAGPLHWYSLDSLNVINSCGMHYYVSNLTGQFFLVSVLLKIFLYEQRYLLFKRVSKSQTKDENPGTEYRGSSEHRSDSFDTMQTEKKKLQSIYYRSTNDFAQKIGIVSFIVFVVVSYILTARSCPTLSRFGQCVNVEDSDDVLLEYAVTYAAVVTAIALYSYYRTRFFPDPFGISREAVINGAILLVSYAIGFTVIYRTIDHLITSPNIRYAPFMSVNLAAFFNMIYSIPYQVYLSTKENSNRVEMTLVQVLNHPAAIKMFRQHLVNELSDGNLDFYLRATQWGKDYDATNGEVRNKIANNIYRKWLAPESVSEVNVSQMERGKVEEIIKSRVNYPRTLFDDIASEVFRLMENDSFFRFKNGPMYRVFVGLSSSDNDLVSSYDLDIFHSKRRLTDL